MVVVVDSVGVTMLACRERHTCARCAGLIMRSAIVAVITPTPHGGRARSTAAGRTRLTTVSAR